MAHVGYMYINDSKHYQNNQAMLTENCHFQLQLSFKHFAESRSPT
jgi:hypothetical protein